MSEPHRIARDAWVVLDYAIYDDEDDLVEATDEEGGRPIGFVYGYGALVPGLERGIIGMAAGETREIMVAPEDAYGPHDPELEMWVDRSEFGPDVAPEDEFVAEDASGEETVLRVVEVTDDAVLVDRNHPLAGESLRFDVVIRAVRSATSDELARARAGRRPLLLPIAQDPPNEPPPRARQAEAAPSESATPPTPEKLGQQPADPARKPESAPPEARQSADPLFDDEQ